MSKTQSTIARPTDAHLVHLYTEQSLLCGPFHLWVNSTANGERALIAERAA